MKLIMENWNNYLKESETQSEYGILYLFEGETVRETSFYDAINILSESDDDIGIFLENWEKSIDYIFSQLDEQDTGAAIDKAYMDATLQGYALLTRAKDKAFAPIIKLSDELKKFGEKNPKTAKAIKLTGGVLLFAAAAAKIAAIVQAGGDASAVEQVAQAVASVDPGVGQEVQEVAQNFTPETVIEFAEEAKQTVVQTADTLAQMAQTDDPGLQQIAQASEQVSNEISEFEQMMIDRQQEKEISEPWMGEIEQMMIDKQQGKTSEIEQMMIDKQQGKTSEIEQMMIDKQQEKTPTVQTDDSILKKLQRRRQARRGG